MFTGKKIAISNLSNTKISTGKQVNTKITHEIVGNNDKIPTDNIDKDKDNELLHIQSPITKEAEIKNKTKELSHQILNNKITNKAKDDKQKRKEKEKSITKKKEPIKEKSQEKKYKNSQSLAINPEIPNNSIPTPVDMIVQEVEKIEQEIPEHELSGDQIFVDFNNENDEDFDDFDEEQRETPQPFFESELKVTTDKNVEVLKEKEKKNETFEARHDEEEDEEPSFIDPNDISQLGMNMDIFSLEVEDIMSKQYFVI